MSLIPVYYRPEKSHVREIYLVEQRVVNRVSLAAHSNIPARDSRTAALAYTTLQINSRKIGSMEKSVQSQGKRLELSKGRPKNASVELIGLSRHRLDVMFGLHGFKTRLAEGECPRSDQWQYAEFFDFQHELQPLLQTHHLRRKYRLA